MMKPDALKQLDEAMAVMLADLNSANILHCGRLIESGQPCAMLRHRAMTKQNP